MRSIQTKILVLILGVILLCSFVIGGNSIQFAEHLSDQSSAQIMDLICQQEGRKIDHIFHSVEQSVKIISYNTVQNVDMIQILSNEEKCMEYMNTLRPILLAAAESADGVVAAYLHFNPKISPPDTGIFFAREDIRGAMIPQEPTDFSKVDIEEQEWYIKPAREGKASWIGPYYNGKSEGIVLSYVTPIYERHTLVGVAGMDIHMSDLMEMVDQIQVYETGHAALVSNTHQMIYHGFEGGGFPIQDIAAWEEFMAGVRSGEASGVLFNFFSRGQDRKATFTDLEAGMYLMVSAPTSEIDAEKTNLINSSMMGVVLVSIFCLFFSLILSQGIVRPLKEITKASKQIAEGNLQVTLEAHSKDEVGQLSESLQQTVECLRVYMDRISDMAYTDPLTGVNSKASYQEEVEKIEKSIRDGFAQFGLIMFDLNNLKIINDKYGHEAGDAYLLNSCKLIGSVFRHSPIFRIGGDEFITILSGRDLLNGKKLLNSFYMRMKETREEGKLPQDKVSIAAGLAVYDEDQDHNYHDVFKRADSMMYRNKELIKKGSEPEIE